MSDALNDVENRIAELQSQQQQIVSEFNSYRDSVVEEITNLLKSAGVFDRINELELERENRKLRDQKAVDDLSTRLNELFVVRDSIHKQSGMQVVVVDNSEGVEQDTPLGQQSSNDNI